MVLADVGTARLMWSSKITTPASQNLGAQMGELARVGVEAARTAGFFQSGRDTPARVRNLALAHRTNVARFERCDRRGLAVERQKLDFECLAAAMNVDDDAHVAGLEAKLDQRFRQNNLLVFADHDRAAGIGCAVINRGTSFPLFHYPDGPHLRTPTGRRLERSVHTVSDAPGRFNGRSDRMRGAVSLPHRVPRSTHRPGLFDGPERRRLS
jgi:hypothetical protein